MNRRVAFGVFVTLVAVAAALALGAVAYNAGLAQGALANAQIIVPPAGDSAGAGQVVPYYAPFYAFGPGRWAMGFGPLGCLGGLFAFFLFFVAFNVMARMAFGMGGKRGWGGRHGLEEWHRRAHESGAAPTAD